jgi:glucan biosynthesis protein
MNDTPETVLANYNELLADKHRPIIHDANRRALANGNGHTLTPPVIPTTPKPLKPLKTNPNQMDLI